MTAGRYELVTRLRSGSPGRTHHNVGLPKAVGGSPSPMREPDVLAIGPTDSGFQLVRLCLDGTLAGDTWHSTLADALSQADYEYPERIQGWETVQNLDDQGVVSWAADVG
jgi:hypothetical protein